MARGYCDLSEQQLRVLHRIGRLMLDGAMCDIAIKLREGGVRDYQETRGLNTVEMDTPDPEFARLIASLLTQPDQAA